MNCIKKRSRHILLLIVQLINLTAGITGEREKCVNIFKSALQVKWNWLHASFHTLNEKMTFAGMCVEFDIVAAAHDHAQLMNDVDGTDRSNESLEANATFNKIQLG